MKCSCLHFSLLKQMESLVPSYNYMKWIKNLTKKLNQLLLTGYKLKIMLLNHCKKWNLETHMTFVDVRLIEETTEYRFVLLKNYMGWSIWSKHFSVCLRQGVHLIWNSEAKSASCSQKTGWNSKKRRGLGGEGHHPCPSSDPCSAYWPIFFTFFPPLWSLDSDYQVFNASNIFSEGEPNRSAVLFLACLQKWTKAGG